MTCIATNMTTGRISACGTSRYCAAGACGVGERSRRHHDGGNAGYCCSVPRCDGSCLPHPQRSQRNALGEVQAAVGNARDEYLLQERIPLANWKEQKKRGVIAASAGNHALALAYHGHLLNVPVTVVTPETAPIMKVSQCQRYGAKVTMHGRDIEEARLFATEIAKKEQLQYVNGYDDPHILSGQGTAALEVLEQMDHLGVEPDAVVIPVGGGGLLAGMATTIKYLNPQMEIIAVESEQCPSFTAAMSAGEPVYTKAHPSLADGLAVPKVGGNAFATARHCTDRTVVVEEDHIALAILRLVEVEKNVVEGAGATSLAACLSGQLDHLRGKNVVVMLCGGNIDTTVLGRCLERGLAADGRLVRFSVRVEDRPGGVASLTKLLHDYNASVKDIFHERTWLQASIHHVEVECVVETRDREHAQSLKQALEKEYGDRFIMWGERKPSSTSLT